MEELERNEKKRKLRTKKGKRTKMNEIVAEKGGDKGKERLEKRKINENKEWIWKEETKKNKKWRQRKYQVKHI